MITRCPTPGRSAPTSTCGPGVPSPRRIESSMADAFSRVSASSSSGSEPYTNAAPARTSATPSLTRTVRNVSPVSMLPSNPRKPIAPPYQRRGERSWSSMNWIARRFGVPVTVTAHAWARKPSSASWPSRSHPSTWPTVWITREYISIWRCPITRTLSASHTRDLSARSTSMHMVSSDSAFSELSSARIRRASSIASLPRATVPAMGQLSMRRPLTRMNISGDAATRYSFSPRFISAP